MLHNAEKLTEAIDAAYEGLYAGDENATAMIGDAGALLSRTLTLSDELRETYGILANISDELSDAVERLKDFRESLDFSPKEYDALETRLAELKRLSRKYGTDEAGLVRRLETDRKRLETIEFSGDREALLKKDLEAQRAECLQSAAVLSEKRKRSPSRSNSASLRNCRVLTCRR